MFDKNKPFVYSEQGLVSAQLGSQGLALKKAFLPRSVYMRQHMRQQPTPGLKRA